MKTDSRQSAILGTLRSAIMYLVMPWLAVNSFILGTLIGPFVSYPKRFKLIIGTFCHSTIWLAKNVAGIRYEVKGLEHLPKDNRGYVIMSKHQSSWETLFLQNIFDPNTVVIKKGAAYIPFFGWGISLLKPIFINRKNGEQALQQIIDKGSERLHKGENILIFPEGTRVNVGERKAFKKGGALLACTSGSDIIPIALNSGEHWNNIRWIMTPGTIKVVIGPVITSKGKTWQDVNQEVELWINTRVDEISAYPSIDTTDLKQLERV
jgi:1-acyl-sn-glycerol-3-phosphate acyltransferase